MARPFNRGEIARYDAVRHRIQHDMRASGDDARITLRDLVLALSAAGYDRSHRDLRAVLSGEKRSRPALRECSAAVAAIRRQRRSALPSWL
ncbi:hypothetical protein [Rubricoccus marinus]|uniref:Uncharacterized protein n=1 Tax=Rubricoccus marinus TaxID=716817 RepID=A0A259TYG7_9BACT|nr:hypothetical protein [Rubricoccus marinus]OZC02751.1 hypothetical protein BSZ36_07055 [Rubricoccus marinus]